MTDQRLLILEHLITSDFLFWDTADKQFTKTSINDSLMLVKGILGKVSSKSIFTFVKIVSKSILKIQDRILSCIFKIQYTLLKIVFLHYTEYAQIVPNVSDQ